MKDTSTIIGFFEVMYFLVLTIAFFIMVSSTEKMVRLLREILKELKEFREESKKPHTGISKAASGLS